jgi:lipopolysaccharide/colanic/teichoic acid biosynthesis glycosyltransferase
VLDNGLDGHKSEGGAEPGTALYRMVKEVRTSRSNARIASSPHTPRVPQHRGRATQAVEGPAMSHELSTTSERSINDRSSNPADTPIDEVVIDLRDDPRRRPPGVVESDGRAEVPAPVDRTIVCIREPPIVIALRRGADVAISLVLMVLLAPVAVVVGIAVALDSKGPVLFRQDRVGLGGRPFRFVKFRTMYVDARERFPDLYDYRFSPDQLATMYFKLAEDPRLTRFGRWLRRTSLDEIPNLWNVLRGDMTLVGPRPELVEMLTNYSPHQLRKFGVKPGLTGLAQTSGRNILRFQETIAADLYYVQHRSLLLDLKILARTVRQVTRRAGAL